MREEQDALTIADLREHIATLEKELAEATFQATFNAGYIDTLKKLGLPERLLEEYQSQKMKIRETESRLKEAEQRLLAQANKLRELNHWHGPDAYCDVDCMAIAALSEKLREAETREAALKHAIDDLKKSRDAVEAREARLRGMIVWCIANLAHHDDCDSYIVSNHNQWKACDCWKAQAEAALSEPSGAKEQR